MFRLQAAGLAPSPVLEGVVQQDGDPLRHRVFGVKDSRAKYAP